MLLFRPVLHSNMFTNQSRVCQPLGPNMINLHAGIYTKSSVLMCSILVYATFIGLFGKEPLRAGEISAQPLCTRVKIDLWPSSKSDTISLKHLTRCNKLRPTICCVCLRFTVRQAAGNKFVSSVQSPSIIKCYTLVFLNQKQESTPPVLKDRVRSDSTLQPARSRIVFLAGFRHRRLPSTEWETVSVEQLLFAELGCAAQLTGR